MRQAGGCTHQAAAEPVCPSIKIIRVDATLSDKRNNVVNRSIVGKAAKSNVRLVNMATNSTMIERAMLKVNNKSNRKGGNGSTIIDSISKISTGPASICH